MSVAEKLLQKVGVKVTDRPTVVAARQSAEEAEHRGKGRHGVYCGAAIQLADGTVVKGTNSLLLHAESAAVIKALKKLAHIPDEMALLPESIIANIASLKKDLLGGKAASLHVGEVLIMLSMSAAVSPASDHCLKKIPLLAGCDMHTTHIIGKGDENGLRKLRLNVTTDALPTSRGFYY